METNGVKTGRVRGSGKVTAYHNTNDNEEFWTEARKVRRDRRAASREKYPELKSLIAKIDAYQNEVEKARLLTEYPEWIIEKVRDNLFRYSSDLVSNIAAANEILCRTQNEFVKRILLEDDAIGDIARIRQEVLFIEEFFNIDLSRYMEYSEQLELTKNYLYRWKKSTVRDYDEFLHPEKKASRLEKEKARKSRKPKKQ